MHRKTPKRPLARAPLGASAVRAADRVAGRLPTIAALASVLAIAATPGRASAIVGPAPDAASVEAGAEADDAGGAEADDARDDASGDEEREAGACPPHPESVKLGGVPPPMRVHGTGCGCGAGDSDGATYALASTALIGAALSRRRRGHDPRRNR